MRISGRAGRRRLHYELAEAMLLGQLLEDLAGLLDGGDGDGADAVRERLYPAAYRDDADAAREFRELTETTLRGERLERLDACRADLADPVGGVDLDLTDADLARRWLQVLNDLRLAHGTRLGVTEDDEPVDPRDGDADDPDDPDDPVRAQWMLYHWLTAVQDTLVGAVMR